MGHTLLTGVTGLLGRFLMRDFLLQDKSLAVLVRPSRMASANQRVDQVLHYWESRWQRSLPRPVVLPGDITEEGLGLSDEHRRWVQNHVDSMIHSAASLTFHAKDGEPWLSNVRGVEHVLDVCRSAKVRKLHYVSTAYTAGLRTGTVFENELDVGQDFGNDYERSKVQAEELVRQAGFLDVLNVLRPSIIVGDSNTGFSSTYHGFYTPLRLICALLSQLSYEQVFAIDFYNLMGLNGDEGKNFVPVDWVSRAMVTILDRRGDQSETYALTSGHPVTSQRMLEIYRQAVREESGASESDLADESSVAAAFGEAFPGAKAVENAYLEQLAVYRSYWRDDPLFDTSNTAAVLGSSMCPPMTDELMIRLARHAIRSKFTWSPDESTRGTVGPAHWISALSACSTGEAGLPYSHCLTISGNEGGSWSFRRTAEEAWIAVDGRCPANSELRITAEAFGALMDQRLRFHDALEQGAAIVVGEASHDSWRQLIEVTLPTLNPEIRA